MKILTILIAFVMFACAHPAPPAAPALTPNLAVTFVHKVDADIACDAYYTDVGAHHVHSATCKLATKQVVYCTISDETWPLCKPIDGSDAKPAPRGPEPPAPKPIEPPPPTAVPVKAKGK